MSFIKRRASINNIRHWQVEGWIMDKFKNKHEKGKHFEEEAAEYLEKKGFEIVATNYETMFGELDIVAEKKKEHLIVFVEVKAKEKFTGMHPFEAVDRRKQNTIKQCAKVYMFENHVENVFVRFDVVGVITIGDEVEEIEYLEDAFQ
jgi:putative endonuclease